MRFHMTALEGVVLVDAEPHCDARGSFTRLFCPQEFATADLGGFWPVQMNLSRNPHRHTLRGMHYQAAPYAEAKLVRVIRGQAQDVVLDLRPESRTYQSWTSVVLDAERMNAVYVPEGCAHGFLTLTPDTEILYLMGRAYVPGNGRGVRWDDRAFAIAWHTTPAVIDPRDAEWPDWFRARLTVSA